MAIIKPIYVVEIFYILYRIKDKEILKQKTVTPITTRA